VYTKINQGISINKDYQHAWKVYERLLKNSTSERPHHLIKKIWRLIQ
jgi:hypothetical protein